MFAENHRDVLGDYRAPSCKLCKTSSPPPQAWLGAPSGITMVSQTGTVQIKGTYKENNEDRHFNGNRRERFIVY